MVVAIGKIRNSERCGQVLKTVLPVYEQIERTIHLQPSVFSSELDGMVAALPGDVVLKLKSIGETAERIKKVVAQRGQSRNGQHAHRAIGRERYRQPRMRVVHLLQIGWAVESKRQQIQPVGVKDPLVLQREKLSAAG